MGDFLNFSQARSRVHRHTAARVLLEKRRALQDAQCYDEHKSVSQECARLWNSYWEYALGTPHYGLLRAEHERYCQRMAGVPEHCN